MVARSESRLRTAAVLVAAALAAMWWLGRGPSGTAASERELLSSGRVASLTAENLGRARRSADILVALYTRPGSDSQEVARASRTVVTLASDLKGRALVGMGDIAADTDLARNAGVTEDLTWVFYRHGSEVGRAAGDQSWFGLQKLLREHLPGSPAIR